MSDGRRFPGTRSVLLGALLVLGSVAPVSPPDAHAQDKPAARGGESDEGGLRELMPAWAPGLEWTVETHPLVLSMPKDAKKREAVARDPKKIVKIKFSVRGAKDLGGVKCYELALTSEATPDDAWTLLVRVQDGSVKELQRTHKGGMPESVAKNERTPFVLFEDSPLCPLDLPLFPRERRDEERTFDLGEGRKVTQKVKVGAASVEVELTTTWRGERLVSKQIWKKDLPFWSEATRTLGTAETDRATLDEKSIALEKR